MSVDSGTSSVGKTQGKWGSMTSTWSPIVLAPDGLDPREVVVREGRVVYNGKGHGASVLMCEGDVHRLDNPQKPPWLVQRRYAGGAVVL